MANQLCQRGLEAFFPHYTERRREGARVQALFPCYLFVRADLEAVGLSTLQWTPGLRGLVAFGGVPAKVTAEAIALVRRRLEQIEAQRGFYRPRFQPGERVRVREGALAGLEGVFEGPLGPADRVRILIRFLGQVNRAIVPIGILEGVARESRPRRTRGRGRQILRSNVQTLAR